MKKSSLLLAFVAVLASTGLTSCYVGADWYPEPPMDWNNTFYDSRLNGYWQLIQINGYNINPGEVNYLYFGGQGRGRYYYLDRGGRYWENTAYWCQNSAGGAGNYQINLQYQSSGSLSTMNYWFSDGNRDLWMQWTNNQGTQTYLYTYYGGAPW